MNIAALAVAIFALPLWVGVIAAMNTVNDSDAAGNALSAAFTVMGIIGLWILLAILLVIAGSKGSMPGWTIALAAVLLPASGAATLAIADLLGRRDEVKWMIAVPALVPLLVMFFAAWAMFPILRTAIPAALAGGVVWGSILILALLPWHRVAVLPGIERARMDKYHAEHDAGLAVLATLTPESSVDQWMKLAAFGMQFHDEQVVGIRTAVHRQAQVETLLAAGSDEVLKNLWQYELEATPALCQTARQMLRQKAESLRPTTAGAKFTLDLRVAFEDYEAPLGWLAKEHCPVSAEIDVFETALRGYQGAEEQGALILAHYREMRQALEKNN